MAANQQQKFIGEIKALGLARTNRFNVMLSPPAAANHDIDRMLLFCSSASLPGINFATVPNRTYGEIREVVYDRMFEPITLTFHVDRKMTVKTIFDDWIAAIINPSDRTIGYYNDYISSLSISIQDVEDKTRYICQLFEAYPKTITTIDLNAADDNDTQRLAVTFAYKHWYAIPVDEDPLTGVVKSAGGFSLFKENFSGFQERFNKGLGEAGNFVTGAVGQFAIKSFSHFSSKLPTIKF